MMFTTRTRVEAIRPTKSPARHPLSKSCHERVLNETSRAERFLVNRLLRFRR